MKGLTKRSILSKYLRQVSSENLRKYGSTLRTSEPRLKISVSYKKQCIRFFPSLQDVTVFLRPQRVVIGKTVVQGKLFTSEIKPPQRKYFTVILLFWSLKRAEVAHKRKGQHSEGILRFLLDPLEQTLSLFTEYLDFIYIKKKLKKHQIDRLLKNLSLYFSCLELISYQIYSSSHSAYIQGYHRVINFYASFYKHHRYYKHNESQIWSQSYAIPEPTSDITFIIQIFSEFS